MLFQDLQGRIGDLVEQLQNVVPFFPPDPVQQRIDQGQDLSVLPLVDFDLRHVQADENLPFVLRGALPADQVFFLHFVQRAVHLRFEHIGFIAEIRGCQLPALAVASVPVQQIADQGFVIGHVGNETVSVDRDGQAQPRVEQLFVHVGPLYR